MHILTVQVKLLVCQVFGDLLKMLLIGLYIGSLEDCMERNPYLQYKWHTFQFDDPYEICQIIKLVKLLIMYLLVMCDTYRYIEVSRYFENIAIRYSMLVYRYFLLIKFCTIEQCKQFVYLFNGLLQLVF